MKSILWCGGVRHEMHIMVGRGGLGHGMHIMMGLVGRVVCVMKSTSWWGGVGHGGRDIGGSPFGRYAAIQLFH